jgi:hypothetical protein
MRASAHFPSASRRRLASLAAIGLAGAALPAIGLAAGPALAVPAPLCSNTATVETCSFGAAAAYSFTVPAGVTTATVVADGGEGGGGDGNNFGLSPGLGVGGPGGEVLATLTGLSGQTLTVTPGGAGNDAGAGLGGAGGGGAGGVGGEPQYDDVGGGGGGATTVTLGADDLVVAGGGGGGAGVQGGTNGGAGGTSSDTTGGNGSVFGAITGGGGGSTVPPAGGAPGNGGDCAPFGTAGTAGQGGAGGTNCELFGGGGGGGGYYGGGGGPGGETGGAGGGSSFPATAVTVDGITVTPQPDTATNSADGFARISFDRVVTTTTLTSTGPNPSTFGQPVTFTATVSPTDGGGTVTFSSNGTPIPGCAGLDLSPGAGSYRVSCTTTALAGGTDSITASYSGDAVYLGSVSNPGVSQVVHPARASLHAFGELDSEGNIEVSALLTAGGRPVAGQTITFTTDLAPTAICTAVTSSRGIASCAAAGQAAVQLDLGSGAFTASLARGDYQAVSAEGVVDGY